MKTWFIQFFSTTLCLFLSNIKICVPRCSFWLILVVSVLNSSSYLIFNSLYEKKKSSNLEISINFGALLYLNELTYHTQIGRIWKRKNNLFKMGPIWLWWLYSFRFLQSSKDGWTLWWFSNDFDKTHLNSFYDNLTLVKPILTKFMVKIKSFLSSIWWWKLFVYIYHDIELMAIYLSSNNCVTPVTSALSPFFQGSVSFDARSHCYF